jgi:hypothetical protein
MSELGSPRPEAEGLLSIAGALILATSTNDQKGAPAAVATSANGRYLRFAAVPYNALCITIAAVPFRKKGGWLAERFLRSKAVLFKEDTSGLVV